MGKIWWAIASSLILHFCLLYILWPSSPRRLVTPVNTATAVVMPTVRLIEPPHADAKLDDIAPKLTQHKQTGTKENLIKQYPPQTETKVGAFLPGYLPIEAVDAPAAPYGDWNIDPDVLPRGYTIRLVLQLWIGANGTIDNWTVDTEPVNEEFAQKALSNLKETRIRPALLRDKAVPSYRRLEMVISRE